MLLNGPRTLRACLITLVMALAGSAPLAAQSSVTDLSIEEVMTLDGGQVFGASERMQPALDAPSSVSFVTAEEIRRYGYRTLSDILRGVRGLYVTNDRNVSLIGVRGFAKPGDYNSRILLLINGHRVNNNVTGQADIGAELALDPAMIERVEIIRGPASSLYGDSAFFGVVNVITRTGASLGGGSLTVEAGTLGTHLTRGAVGHRFANGLEVALSGTDDRSDGMARLYYPAFDTPATNHGVAEGLDGESVDEFYGRLDFKGLILTAAYGERQRDVPTASFGAIFNEQVTPQHNTDHHTLLDGQYARTFAGTRVTVRASVDRYLFDATSPLAGGPDGTPVLTAHTLGLGNRWSVSSGLTRVFLGGQTVTAGVEFIDNLRQDQTARFVSPPVTLFDSRRASTQRAVYAQDEIKLTRWLIVNAGLRYDSYDEFVRVTPRTALIVRPSSRQSVKYLYGRAFRAPNTFEQNVYYFGPTVEQLHPETIDTHEVVWETYVNDRVRTSVSTYWYQADQLITGLFDASTTSGITYTNEGQVRAKGLELEAQLRIKRDVRALASYALQSAVDQDTRIGVSNSPRHILKARISVPGPLPRSFVSVEGHYLSRRATLDGFRVSPAAIVNLTVVAPLGRAWALDGGVRNLFDAQYADPASSQHRQDVIPQNGRTARIGLRWTFWAP